MIEEEGWLIKQEITRFETLNELYYRGLLDNESLQTQEWRTHQAIKAVEDSLIACFQSQLPSYADLISNLTMDYYGPIQVDLLVVADHVWWAIDWQPLLGSALNSNRHKEAFVKSLARLKDLARSLDRKIQVHHDQFNEDHPGVVKNPLTQQILAWNQRLFQSHVHDLVAQVPFVSGDKVYQYHRVLNRYRQPLEEELPMVDEACWQGLKKGCRCLNCQSYTLKIKRKTCQCLHCGHSYSKAQMGRALYRQLQALAHHDHVEMSRDWMLELCDYQLRSTSIWKLMQEEKK